MENSMGDTADEKSFQISKPSRSHDDHFALFYPGDIRDNVTGRSLKDPFRKFCSAFAQGFSVGFHDFVGFINNGRNRILKVGFSED